MAEQGDIAAHDWMVRQGDFYKGRFSDSLIGILLTNGVVFSGNRFYVEPTDTRCVGLNLWLRVS